MNDKNNTEATREQKRRFQLWLKPSVLDTVDDLYENDNCGSRSEFIEKAIQFYAGYIYAQRSQDYMPKILTSTLKGIVDESTNKISRTLFKMAVEQAISMNVIAATCNISPAQLDQLRGNCVKQVKQSNGAYSFEDAYKWQKG